MKEKIQYFPITAFSMIMGLSGLSIAFAKFYHLQWLPRIYYDVTLFFTLALFLIFTYMYGRKAILHFDEVKADFMHRIRINFFSAITISFLLLSIAFMTFWPMLSLVFWWIGVISHTVIMFYTISIWIQHNFEIQFMNPAWFIPVVGNILVPVAGVEYMPKAFSFIYFAIGFFFWIILFAIFLNRAIFHHQMPQKFIPTLFILIAPPAIGFIAYIRIAQSWDGFALFLFLLHTFLPYYFYFFTKVFQSLNFTFHGGHLLFP